MEILDLFKFLIAISGGICLLFFLRLAYYATTMTEGLYKEYVCNLNAKVAVIAGIFFLFFIIITIIITKFN